MKRYFIESAQCDQGDNGFACGPGGGSVVAEVKIIVNENESIYFTLAETCGLPNFYITAKSYFDKLVSLDIAEDEVEELERFWIPTGEYDEINQNTDEEWFEIYRYLIYVVRSDNEECQNFLEATIGKYLDEIKVPLSDVEEV